MKLKPNALDYERLTGGAAAIREATIHRMRDCQEKGLSNLDVAEMTLDVARFRALQALRDTLLAQLVEASFQHELLYGPAEEQTGNDAVGWSYNLAAAKAEVIARFWLEIDAPDDPVATFDHLKRVWLKRFGQPRAVDEDICYENARLCIDADLDAIPTINKRLSRLGIAQPDLEAIGAAVRPHAPAPDLLDNHALLFGPPADDLPEGASVASATPQPGAVVRPATPGEAGTAAPQPKRRGRRPQGTAQIPGTVLQRLAQLGISHTMVADIVGISKSSISRAANGGVQAVGVSAAATSAFRTWLCETAAALQNLASEVPDAAS